MKKIFSDNYGINKLFIKNLILYFAIIITFIILPVFVLYNSLTNRYYTQMQVTNEGTINRSVDLFEEIVSQIEIYVVDLSVKQEVQAFLAAENEYYFLGSVQEYLKFYKSINNYVDRIYIYNAKNNLVVTSEGYADAKNSETDIMSDFGIKITDSIYFDALARNNVYPYIIRITKVLDNGSFAAVDIDLKKLNALINSSSVSEGYNNVFLLNDAGKVICSENISSYFGKSFSEIIIQKDDMMVEFDNNLYVCEQRKSDKYPVYVVSMTNIEYFSGMRWYTVVYITSIGIVSFILSFLIAYFISVRSINPIRHIIGALKERDVDDEILKKAPKEVVYIIEDLLKNIGNKTEIIQDTNMRLLLFKLANMEALQAQINPHFLHNTLDSINWLAYYEMGKENNVSELLADLSDLYRITLQTDEYIIPLGTEIQHITMYINMLNIRFDDPISFETDIDEKLLDCEVLKFMLQPIVENSVYHGIVPTERGGIVKISAHADGELLYVEVSDNGVGMSDEIIHKINEELKRGPEEFDESILKIMYGEEMVDKNLQTIKKSWWLKRKKADIGVGIKNTNNRIKLIFGQSYEVAVQKGENGGTRVIIKLPLNESVKEV